MANLQPIPPQPINTYSWPMSSLSIRGSDLFHTFASNDISPDEKLQVILNFKDYVKKEKLSFDDIPTYFQALSVAIDIPENGILEHAFTTLCHFIKRIGIQNGLDKVLENQSYLVLPILFGRLGDSSSSTVRLTKRTLEAYFLVAQDAFEKLFLENGLGNRNTPIIVESINFLLYIIQELSSNYKIMVYVPRLCTLLATNSPDIYLAIEDLFVYFFNLKPNKHYRFELEKEMIANKVSLDTRNELMGKILNNGQAILSSHHQDLLQHGLHQNYNVPAPAAVPEANTEQSTSDTQDFHRPTVPQNTEDDFIEMDNSPNSTIISIKETLESNITPEMEKVLGKINYSLDTTLAATNVDSARHLSQLFEKLLVPFEGRETEHNWSVREKSILRVRSILRGNAPIDYKEDLLHNLREFSDGFNKGMSSLRTTLSSNGCLLVKDCTIIMGPEFDTVVDAILPTLLKLCSATKQIASTNANMALCSIFVNLPFSHRYLQKFLIASNEKNVLPRSFSGIWVQIYILRFYDYHGFTSAHGASGLSGIDIACKVLTKILGDANPTVRQVAKDCFWTFCSKFPTHAETLLSKLEPKIVKIIERSKPADMAQPVKLPTATTAKKQRPSLKETIMEKNKELRLKQKAASRASSRMDVDSMPVDDKQPRVPSRNASLTRKPIHEVKSSIRASKTMLEPYNFTRNDGGRTAKPTLKPPIEKYYPPRKNPVNQTAKSQETAPPKSSIQLNTNYLRQSEEDLKQPTPEVYSQTHTEVDVPTSPLPDLAVLADQTDKPIKTKSSDPILSYLLSDQIEVVEEGVSLLKYAIISNEDMPVEIKKILRKISLTSPVVLCPLLSTNVFRKSCKFFEIDDFLRICAISRNKLDDNYVNLLISISNADELFGSLSRLLFFINHPSEIMDDDKAEFAMQIYTHRDTIVRFIIDFLLVALDRIAISDSSILKITTNYLELVHKLKDTADFEAYSKLIKKLSTINPVLFKTELGETDEVTKTAVEIILGIKSGNYTAGFHTDDEFSTSTKYVNANSMQFSPSKNEFTMLIPMKKENDEYTCYKKKAQSEEPVRHASKSPIQLESLSLEHASYIQPAETKMDDGMDIDCSFRPNDNNDEAPVEEHVEDILMTGHQEQDLSRRSEISNEQVAETLAASPFPREIVEHQPHTLANDFSQVQITESLSRSKFEDRDSLQLLIEKVDPLKSISSKNRHINIFEDAAGSPQKVKDYEYLDHNWYNFQLSKFSLGESFEDKDASHLSIENFCYLCKQISLQHIHDDTFISILTYIQELRLDQEFASYFQAKGKFEIENSMWKFFENVERLDITQILSGLIIIKLLLVNKVSVTLNSLWGLLTRLYVTYTSSSELYLAIGEVFDELLTGLYSSKDVLSVTLHSLQELDFTSSKCSSAILGCLLKVLSLNSTIRIIDTETISTIDETLHNILSHDEVEIRRLSVEIYGQLFKASKLNSFGGCKVMIDINNSLTIPQKKLINYYSQ